MQNLLVFEVSCRRFFMMCIKHKLGIQRSRFDIFLVYHCFCFGSCNYDLRAVTLETCLFFHIKVILT